MRVVFRRPGAARGCAPRVLGIFAGSSFAHFCVPPQEFDKRSSILEVRKTNEDAKLSYVGAFPSFAKNDVTFGTGLGALTLKLIPAQALRLPTPYQTSYGSRSCLKSPMSVGLAKRNGYMVERLFTPMHVQSGHEVHVQRHLKRCQRKKASQGERKSAHVSSHKLRVWRQSKGSSPLVCANSRWGKLALEWGWLTVNW